MRRYAYRVLPIAALFLFAVHAHTQAGAQAPRAQGGGGLQGVAPVRQIDRTDVRVSDVGIEVGGVRATHTHPESVYHLFIPLSGKFELTIGNDPPIIAVPGHAYYIPGPTPHGFKNIANTESHVMEVFMLNEQGSKEAADRLAKTPFTPPAPPTN